MPLPELIEILPLDTVPTARITVPGSKSLTNRALVLAALGHGVTKLCGALWSEDTQVMVDALRVLGFSVQVETDPLEAGNRIITVQGRGGVVPAGGPGRTLDLFVGNAGTAARFLAAMVCLGQGAYRLHGVPRMHERPQAPLFQALRRLGYRVESANDRLPAVVFGGGPRPGRCVVSLHDSSQFASALLLCAKIGQWEIQVQGENNEEAPYVEMTRQLRQVFPPGGVGFQIEPDASSGAYFWAVNALGDDATLRAQPVRVEHWPASGWQVDARFPGLLPLTRPLSRARDLGDAIMMAIVLAPLARQPLCFTDLGRLRVQECERVRALRTELAKCGAAVREKGDTLEFVPGPLQGAEIATYQDHRMAMCFAILGLKVPGIRLQNPACVKKTFPNFFQKLATPPPAGLGARIVDGRTGRALALAELAVD